MRERIPCVKSDDLSARLSARATVSFADTTLCVLSSTLRSILHSVPSIPPALTSRVPSTFLRPRPNPPLPWSRPVPILPSWPVPLFYATIPPLRPSRPLCTAVCIYFTARRKTSRSLSSFSPSPPALSNGRAPSPSGTGVITVPSWPASYKP
jgi:hypothetical protein